MTGHSILLEALRPLSQRKKPETLFLRLIGRDEAGEVYGFLKEYYLLTQKNGLFRKASFPNPTEASLSRFFELMGPVQTLDRSTILKHLTLAFGQLRPPQKEALADAALFALDQLRRRGANDNILKNAYVKWLSWLQAPCAPLLSSLQKENPPRLLLEGEVSKYDILLLSMLHKAGCDIIYLHFTDETSYNKADPAGSLSIPVVSPLRTAPPVPYITPNKTTQVPPTPRVSPGGTSAAATPKVGAQVATESRTSPASTRSAPVRQVAAVTSRAPVRQNAAAVNVTTASSSNAAPPSLAPPPWAGLEAGISINLWLEGRAPWEAVLLPSLARSNTAKERLPTLFAAVFGMDDYESYRNRLFTLKSTLEARSAGFVLITQPSAPPTMQETEVFRSVPQTLPRAHLIRTLSPALRPNCGTQGLLLAQQAFSTVLETSPEMSLPRLYNYGIRLACWVLRYAEELFRGYDGTRQPTLLFYAPLRDAELSLLWVLARMGVDVLYFSPAPDEQKTFAAHFLPPIWENTVFPTAGTWEPFPQREERVRAGTTAYHASKGSFAIGSLPAQSPSPSKRPMMRCSFSGMSLPSFAPLLRQRGELSASRTYSQKSVGSKTGTQSSTGRASAACSPKTVTSSQGSPFFTYHGASPPMKQNS